MSPGAPQVVKDAADMQMKKPIFAKQKTRNEERETGRRLTRTDKGANYGIPDSTRRRSRDGPLCLNHHRLPQTARMVTVNRR